MGMTTILGRLRALRDKHGDAQLDGLLRRYLDFPVSELEGTTSTPEELRSLAKRLIAGAKRLNERAEKEKRELSDDESSVFDYALVLADALKEAASEGGNAPIVGGRGSDSRAERSERHAARFIGKDAEGRSVRGLGPDESFAAYLRESGESREASVAEKEGLGLGEFVRAMVLGPRNEAERRALAEGSVGAGGATIPTFLAADCIDMLRAQTRVVTAGATTVPLRGYQMKVARLTGDPGFAWHVENAADISLADPTFDNVTFQSRTLAGLIRVSRELLLDSLNLNDAVNQAFANSFAVELDRVAMIGSGSGSEPTGIKNVSGVGSVVSGAGNGAALTNYDLLIDAVQTILDAKGNMPSAFILPPRTLAKLGKLKDGQQQPQRLPGIIEKIPFLFSQSLPVNETEGSSNASSSIITGYFPELWIGVRAELQIELLKELFASNYQYGLLASLRVDVQLAHPGSFCRIKGVL